MTSMTYPGWQNSHRHKMQIFVDKKDEFSWTTFSIRIPKWPLEFLKNVHKNSPSGNVH